MEYIFLLISLHTSYNTRVAELFISEELIHISMILESSHATDCDKSLYHLLSPNRTQENYSNYKKAYWNVDFSKFFLNSTL